MDQYADLSETMSVYLIDNAIPVSEIFTMHNAGEAMVGSLATVQIVLKNSPGVCILFEDISDDIKMLTEVLNGEDGHMPRNFTQDVHEQHTKLIMFTRDLLNVLPKALESALDEGEYLFCSKLTGIVSSFFTATVHEEAAMQAHLEMMEKMNKCE